MSKVISSFCSADQPSCVEVEYRQVTGTIRVSDTKNHARGGLYFTREEWDAFVAGVKNGEFDYDVLRSIADVAAETGDSAVIRPGAVAKAYAAPSAIVRRYVISWTEVTA